MTVEVHLVTTAYLVPVHLCVRDLLECWCKTIWTPSGSHYFEMLGGKWIAARDEKWLVVAGTSAGRGVGGLKSPLILKKRPNGKHLGHKNLLHTLEWEVA
ncbi:hypothetical protein J6590_024959 [Homalodisca vitripennis]|nr:hypothetical protein J6590_024959 [Homalodisca vitripennis]